MWFWRDVVDDIPLKPENFKILHPEIIHKTGQVLQKYALKQRNVSSCMQIAHPSDKLRDALTFYSHTKLWKSVFEKVKMNNFF